VAGVLSKLRPQTRTARIIAEYGLTAVVAIAVAVAVQSFVVKPYLIPSSSMANTLVPGQRILVDRLAYRFGSVHRGDIVVFRGPQPPQEVMIKRVVGLPGDVLSIRDGRLYVNDTPSPDLFVDRIAGAAEPTMPPDPNTSDDPGAAWSLARPYRVPAGCYFVMGDNRTDSDDSRYWGPVPHGAIIGEAFLSYWPPARIGGL
jgi:signal peptidase I